MIDSIKISKYLSPQEVESMLHLHEPEEELVNRKTGELLFKSNIGNNFTVVVRGSCLKVYGSLSKLYFGSNTKSLLWYQVKPAIQKLEEVVGVNLKSAKITRLDIESTFLLPNTVKSYFSILGDNRFFKSRFQDKTTLYYKNYSRTLCFYDKSKKSRADKEDFFTESDHAMRVEFRMFSAYLKLFAKKVDRNAMLIQDLFDQEIQRDLLNLWLQHYNDITKTTSLKLDMTEVSGVKDFKEVLQAAGIEKLGGVNQVISMIDSARADNQDMDRKLVSRLKGVVRTQNRNPLVATPSQQIAELTATIAIAYIANLLGIHESY